MNGRGIVISFAEQSIPELKRLLKVLRLSKNKLPIQLVHRGDVYQDSLQQLVDIARNPIMLDDNSIVDENPQNIWFVNAARSLTPDHANLFERFANKWIAVLFSSFEEIILMDSDVVPFDNLENLFLAEEYKDNQAYFFKDRAIGQYLSSSNKNLYRLLLPLSSEYELFNIAKPTAFTTGNDFFKYGYSHLMESGVLVIKKSNHLPGLLISTAMQLWPETSGSIYGDKELFWLGQSIAGNENYTFNKFPAGAIGKFKQQDDKTSICSTQLGHFDKDLKLLWTNSGLKQCKKTTWKKDFKKSSYLQQKYKTQKALKSYYQSSVEIEGAIIPFHTKLTMMGRFKGVKEGFHNYKKLGCIGYFWCAFDIEQNKVIEFSEDQLALIDKVVRVWNSF